ncbi:Transmembrane protein 245 [Mus musculus] [Rhizoctonia solani]|uniref:Transmembrane protein 245 [Mus musculus] n=1 Tax=Rhizoctonia solani TaxID=456999 RepID=A0A0K6G7Y6_9AGAM|nr:Transmembrane protein 245 [Mus musculus] [Rhizoctonia solani]
MAGPKPPRASPKNDQEKLDSIIAQIRDVGFTLGEFLYRLFGEFTKEELNLHHGATFFKRSPSHAAAVSFFLSTQPKDPKHSVRSIISAIHGHSDSVPTLRRATTEHAALPNKDPKPMARHQLTLWAIDTVVEVICSEANILAEKTSELRLPASQQNWQAVVDFSLVALQDCIQRRAPVLYRLVSSVATSSAHIQHHAEGALASLEEAARTRSPSSVIVPAILMLVGSRNIRANYFQKVIGAWLFSCQAPAQVYQNLNRMGISVSYKTVTDMLKQLAESAAATTQEIAAAFCFLIVIDNINRLRKFWNPRLGQQDIMMSGAASTLIEMRGVPPGAFNPQPYLDSRKQNLRSQLTPNMLWSRINQPHLGSVLALHCVNILASHCSSLSESGILSYVTNELRTTYALHRMEENTITQAHTLSSTALEQGSAEGNGNNLREILLNELKLPPELVAAILIIITGDLGTVEKLRALIALESSCKHGFSSFSWVLPLVQLWHMGWADLARLISTHWGQPATKDPSNLWHKCALLGRNVKPAERPDYYSAQALILDVLEADVLDCWRLLLDVPDINEHFRTIPALPTGPELFERAKVLVTRWASGNARNAVLMSAEFWDGPKAPLDAPSDCDSDTPLADIRGMRHSQAQNMPCSPKSAPHKAHDPDIPFEGDVCLANSIQRMEESLIHREFLWAVADGDIGRVMQVMSVWQFSFMGANKSKYATELLELACGFMFEFPEALQIAIKNNWLCNFSGLNGCWMPMDLMQEHNIRELKDKAQRRDTDFESSFFQHVISRNIRWFAATRSSVTKALHDGKDNRSTTHSKSDNSDAITLLLASLELERVHSFVPGRSHGWLSRDNRSEGRRLMPTKLQHFLHRTTQTASETSADDPVDPAENTEDEATNDPLVDIDELPYDNMEPLAPGMIIDGRYIPGDIEEPDLDEIGDLVRSDLMPQELRGL